MKSLSGDVLPRVNTEPLKEKKQSGERSGREEGIRGGSLSVKVMSLRFYGEGNGDGLTLTFK